MKSRQPCKEDRSKGWIDMAFFCLHRLKMSPGQVAEMLSPDDEDFRATITVHLRDHYARVLTDKVLRDSLAARRLT